jgi:hypothetical protein
VFIATNGRSDLVFAEAAPSEIANERRIQPRSAGVAAVVERLLAAFPGPFQLSVGCERVDKALG